MLPIAKTPPRFREIETLVSFYLSRKQGVRGREEGVGREGEERKGGNDLGFHREVKLSIMILWIGNS